MSEDAQSQNVGDKVEEHANSFEELLSELFRKPRKQFKLGRYSIIKTLGRSGIAEVFLATREDIGQRVALKIVRKDLSRSSISKIHLRFRREAATLASLNHPNICRFYDYGEFDGTPFIAMEAIQGRTLNDWLKTRPRTIAEILDVFIQIAKAIEHTHNTGLIHSCLSPRNIIVDNNGNATLIDFGLSKKIPPNSQTKNWEKRKEDVDYWYLTDPRTLLGIPTYMAPEQFDGSPAVSSDIYAFTTILYEALSGNRPDSAKTIIQLVQARRHEPVPAELEAWDRVPRSLRRTILRGIQPDPRSRHADMHELLAELQHARMRHTHRPTGILRAIFGVAGATVALSLGTSWPIALAVSALAFAAVGLLFACLTFFRLGSRTATERGDDSSLRYERAVQLGSRSIVLGGSVSLLLLLWG